MDFMSRTGQGRGVPPVISRRPFKPVIHQGSNVPSIGALASVLQKLKTLDVSCNSQSALLVITEHVKSMCTTDDAVNKVVDFIYNYGLESKVTAHIGAIFCNCLQNLEVRKTKFKSLLMSKIQSDYERREINYGQPGLFQSSVTFACEVFYHVRLSTGDYECLIPLICTYFSMLLYGGSEAEVELFTQHFTKCAKQIQIVSTDEFNDLLLKVRKIIISESSSVVIRSSLLQAFEVTITNPRPLNQKAKALYEVFNKSTGDICVDQTL